MAENDFLVGKLVADRFRIVRRLGAGGMGTVFVAVQEPLGREVALKVVRRELDDDDRTMERFRREGQALSQLHHPHIVTLHDFGELPGGALWIAMEFVRGENLRQRLRRAGPLPVAQTVALMRSIASALAAAHACGVIHRDLKPENILVMEAAGTSDFVKVVDFGVAKLTGVSEADPSAEQLTRRGSIIGTPGYIAPEVALEGNSADPRSDLYSLGVICFELLTGKPPFRAPTTTALLMAHALEPTPPLPPQVPLHVAGLVQRLLAKAPSDRPDSAEELVVLIDALPRFDSAPLPRLPGPDVEADAQTVADTARPTRAARDAPPEPIPAAHGTIVDGAAPGPVAVLAAETPRRRSLPAQAALAVFVAALLIAFGLALTGKDHDEKTPDRSVSPSDAGVTPHVATPVLVGPTVGKSPPDAGPPSATAPVGDAGASQAPDAAKQRPRKPPRKKPGGGAEAPPDIY